jgi:hypothetical protein
MITQERFPGPFRPVKCAGLEFFNVSIQGGCHVLPWWQAYPGIGANPSAEKFGREIGEKDGQNYTRQRTERQALLFVILRVDSLLGLADFLSILPAKAIRFQTRFTEQPARRGCFGCCISSSARPTASAWAFAW